MRLALSALSALGLLSAACVADEDNGPVRDPGGGGGSGSSQGGDARMIDGGGGDGGGGAVNGLVCVVSDLRQPDTCPAVAARSGVRVKVTGSSATTTSGSDGRFTIAASGAVAVLELADGSTTLERSVVPVAVGPSLVHTPVILAADFADVITSLDQAVPEGGGTVVVYVQDGAGPAAGVAFDQATGSSIAPYYDDGALQWRQGGGTGAAGVALFVDVPAGTATLTGAAPDLRVANVPNLPVVAGAITFVRVSLANP